jgi:HemY protein
MRMRSQADAGRLALTRAAIDARDWSKAREALTPVLTTRPTQNALLLMAEIEEGEHGDRGRAREWLARAVHAPRDPAWVADGMVLDEWAPVSPVTGRLDAVEWRAPAERLSGPEIAPIEEADLRSLPLLSVVPSEPASPPAAPVAPPEPDMPAIAPAPAVAGAPRLVDVPAVPAAPPAPGAPRRDDAGIEVPAAPRATDLPSAARRGNGEDAAEPGHPPDDPGLEPPPEPQEERRRFRLF